MFLQEDVDICFIAIETCFLGKMCSGKGKILSDRVKIWQFFYFVSVLRLKNFSLLKI